MNIDEARKMIKREREALEKDILQILSSRIEQFKKDTGLEIENIHIRMEPERLVGEEKEKYNITDVTVAISI